MSFSKIFHEIENTNFSSIILERLFEYSSLENHKNEQMLSAFCHIILKNSITKAETINIDISKIKNDTVKHHLMQLLKKIDPKSKNHNDIYYKLYYTIELNSIEIQSIVDMSMKQKVYSLELTVILNLIKFKGLSSQNIYLLSLKMAESGNIYDYRNNKKLNYKAVLRRYPTGGVSEKIALIMPSLLQCISDRYPFVSPFLVAKTLGFTGGTWDKLSCIPDFNFPNSGDESLSILAKDHVCMTVAQGDYAPSDTFLYQLRSATNTVDSLPLIISSIASKQIANPVDTLLLDIRYGKNAFLKDIQLANDFFNQIKAILENFNIDTIAEFTDTENLLGSSIGNYLEVIESICILKNQSDYDNFSFDTDLLEKQKELVVTMTTKVISHQYNINTKDIAELCLESFLNFKVFNSFKKILISHGVLSETISKIEGNEIFDKFFHLKEYPIIAHQTGVIEEINQKNIGNFVNMELGAGTNYFNKENRLYDGVLLKKKVLSQVNKDAIIAIVYSTKDINTKSLSSKFFTIK
jgi:pyrimidine-nucleoside phosphorylase